MVSGGFLIYQRRNRPHSSINIGVELSLSLSDEDITPSDAPPSDPPTIMQGPMTKAQRRQLNLEGSSFLIDPFHTFENRFLPNDAILIRNIGEGHEGLRGRGGGNDYQQGRPIETGGPVQHDFESASASRTSLP